MTSGNSGAEYAADCFELVRCSVPEMLVHSVPAIERSGEIGCSEKRRPDRSAERCSVPDVPVHSGTAIGSNVRSDPENTESGLPRPDNSDLGTGYLSKTMLAINS